MYWGTWARENMATWIMLDIAHGDGSADETLLRMNIDNQLFRYFCLVPTRGYVPSQGLLMTPCAVLRSI